MHTTTFTISFFLSILLLTYNLVQPLIIKNSGYEIYDLQSTTEDAFTAEASSWTVTPLVDNTQPVFSQCGTAYLLGGYKVLSNVGSYSRTYNNLPTHSSVYVLISFYFIDRWEPQDEVSATITDGVNTVYSSTIFKLNSGQNNWVDSVCGATGGQGKDLLDVTLVMAFLHSGPNLKITISNSVSNSNLNRGFNGIRNVRIISSTQTTLSSNAACGVAPAGSIETTYKCECDSGQFKTSNGCESCDETCGDCFAAGPNSCISCKSNFVYSGNQCIECHSTCKTCSNPGANQCLTCPDNWYLYADGTCRNECSGAYTSQTEDGILKCTLNCVAPNYVYANNTCLGDCNSPFTRGFQGASLLCTFPCDMTNFYSTESGSCSTECNPPYQSVNEGGFKYCTYPCSSQQFLWEDGSCIDKCGSPLISSETNGKKSCKSPCQSSDMYYYPSTKSCDSTCKDSYVAKQEQYYKSCTGDNSKETVILGTVNSVTDSISATGLVVSSIVSSSSPSGAMLGVLTKTFAYIRYLQIVYSAQLQQLLNTFDTSFVPIEYDSEQPEFVSDESTYKPAPEVFAKWEIYPSFLANFWSDMISFAIAGGALGLFKVIEMLLNKTFKKPNFAQHAKKGKVASQNFLLTFIYNSYGDILFFSMLEFKTTTFGSAKSYIIVPVIIFFMIAGILIFVFHVWLLKKYRILNKQCVNDRKSAELKDFLEKYAGAEMVYKGFKTDTFSQQACLFFMTIRDALFNLIFIFLYEYPLFEVIAIMILNILMLVYLFIKRPLADKLEQGHQLASEFLVFLLNICIIVTATLDQENLEATGTRDALGKVVIAINIIFNALIAIVMIIKAYAIAKKMYNNRKGGIKKMLEALQSSKSEIENTYTMHSEMNALDKFSSSRFKTEEKIHDLTFEASAPKDNPVLNNNKTDKYLANGMERRSVIFEIEMRDETQTTQRTGGSHGNLSTRNPRLEPSSPIVFKPAADNEPLKNNSSVWDLSGIAKAMKKAFKKEQEEDVSR